MRASNSENKNEAIRVFSISVSNELIEFYQFDTINSTESIVLRLDKTFTKLVRVTSQCFILPTVVFNLTYCTAESHISYEECDKICEQRRKNSRIFIVRLSLKKTDC